MADKQNATDAVAAVIAVNEAAWTKLGQAAGLIAVRGEGSLAPVELLRSQASQNITLYKELQASIQAAASVVSAPSPEQIESTRQLITTVRNVAAADATVSAGLDAIRDALGQASTTADDVKVG